jgi:hypothetical protein
MVDGTVTDSQQIEGSELMVHKLLLLVRIDPDLVVLVGAAAGRAEVWFAARLEGCDTLLDFRAPESCQLS